RPVRASSAPRGPDVGANGSATGAFGGALTLAGCARRPLEELPVSRRAPFDCSLEFTARHATNPAPPAARKPARIQAGERRRGMGSLSIVSMLRAWGAYETRGKQRGRRGLAPPPGNDVRSSRSATA